MKRILFLALTLACILLLFGCEKSNNDAKDPTVDNGSNNNSHTNNNENNDENSEPNESTQAHVCTYDTREETVLPSCEEKGYIKSFCSCGKYVIAKELQPLDHAFGVWEVIKSPTLSEEGKLFRACERGHDEYMALPKLNDKDYSIESKDGEALSCNAPSSVYFVYGHKIFDDALSCYREFKFDALYTAEHTLSLSKYVYSSESHYRVCTYCEKVVEASAESHSMKDSECSVCNYKHCDVVYTEETYGLAVSYTANAEKIVIPEYYSGPDINHVGKKIVGIKSFKDNTKLRSVTIPSSLKFVDTLAFEGCDSLESVYYNGGIDDWCGIKFGPHGNPMNHATKFFMANGNGRYKEVTEISIPETVTVISDSAFEGFKSLKSLTIPKSVIAFGDDISGVFSNYASIGSVYYKGDIEDWCKIKFNAQHSNPMQFTDNFYMTDSLGEYYQPTSLVLPESIKFIGDYQFISYTHLTHVFTSNTIDKIGKHAFSDCTSLIYADISRGCELIDDCAFSGCSLLSRIDLPMNLKACGKLAFENCSRISTVYYYGDWDSWSKINFSTAKSNPMHVNAYKSFAESIVFYRYFADSNEFCSVVGEVITLSDGLSAIGDYQFYGFSRIARIILPDGIESIGREAFAYCGNLNAIVIPKSVKRIGESIIFGTNNLTKIYYEGSSDDWQKVDISSENDDLNRAAIFYCASTEYASDP